MAHHDPIQVFYCDDSRLGREAGTNLLFDRGMDLLIERSIGGLC